MQNPSHGSPLAVSVVYVSSPMLADAVMYEKEGNKRKMHVPESMLWFRWVSCMLIGRTRKVNAGKWLCVWRGLTFIFNLFK